jgi:hypothetical protein
VFLAVGFEPATATVDSRELYAPTERRAVKVSIYIHQIKAFARYDVQPFQKKCMTKLRVELVESCQQTPGQARNHWAACKYRVMSRAIYIKNV